MSVTLKDIAAAAGVSVTTVSYVLNNKGTIPEDTRARVKAAIRDLKYKRQGRNCGNLALVSNEGLTAPLTPAIYQHAAEFGFALHLVHWKETLAVPPDFNPRLRIVGVLVYGGLWKCSLLEEVAQRYPTVLLGSSLPTLRTDAVWVDNHGGLYTAMDYLLKQGHRRIGFINGPADSATSAEKRIGFERAIRHSGISAIETTLVEADHFTTESGQRAASALLDRLPNVTAVICGEVELTLGLLAELKHRSLSVPADISVLAFRDDILLKSVTVINIPEDEIAREAISRLVQRIDSPNLPGQRILVQPQLLYRGSVANHAK